MNIEAIRTAVPGKVIWDKGSPSSVKGLHVKVSPLGKKSFMFYYCTKQGVERRPKLGTFGDITLTEARSIAKELSREVALGRDPKGEWQTAKAELTMTELFNKTVEKYWDQPRFQESGWLWSVRNHWKNNIEPYFGSRKLSEVTPPTLIEWHTGMKEKPFAANRSLEVVSKMFNFAEQLGIRTPGSNPCAIVPHHSERSRKRFPTPEELRKIKVILDRDFEKYPQHVTFLYLLAFTGSRPMALSRAKFSELQILSNEAGERFGVLTSRGKSSEKTGEDEVVLIPPTALKMLESLPKAKNGSLLGIKSPKHYWAKVQKEVGCLDLWYRDLRRGFATIGLSKGVDLDTIGELLNHSSTQTTKVYAKLMLGNRIEAAMKIAHEVEKMMESK